MRFTCIALCLQIRKKQYLCWKNKMTWKLQRNCWKCCYLTDNLGDSFEIVDVKKVSGSPYGWTCWTGVPPWSRGCRSSHTDDCAPPCTASTSTCRTSSHTRCRNVSGWPTPRLKGLSPTSKGTSTTTAGCQRRTASGSSVGFSWQWVKSNMPWKRNSRLLASSRFTHDLSSFAAVLFLTGLLPCGAPRCFKLRGKDAKLFSFVHSAIWPIRRKVFFYLK